MRISLSGLFAAALSFQLLKEYGGPLDSQQSLGFPLFQFIQVWILSFRVNAARVNGESLNLEIGLLPPISRKWPATASTRQRLVCVLIPAFHALKHRELHRE